jgi:hypothetical protein
MRVYCSASVVLALLALGSCSLGVGEKRYFDRRGSVQHFKRNETQLNMLVSDWEQRLSGGSFDLLRWKTGTFAWNGTEIKPTGAGYEVVRAKKFLRADISSTKPRT